MNIGISPLMVVIHIVNSLAIFIQTRGCTRTCCSVAEKKGCEIFPRSSYVICSSSCQCWWTNVARGLPKWDRCFENVSLMCCLRSRNLFRASRTLLIDLSLSLRRSLPNCQEINRWCSRLHSASSLQDVPCGALMTRSICIPPESVSRSVYTTWRS